MRKRFWSSLFLMAIILNFAVTAFAGEFVGGIGAALTPEEGFVWENRDGVWAYYPAEGSEKTGHYELAAIRFIHNGTEFVQASADAQIVISDEGEIIISRKNLQITPDGGLVIARNNTKSGIQPYGIGDLGYAPTYLNVWPYPSNIINPEDQCYWYNSTENAIYIAFANAIPMPFGPNYYLDLEELPSINVTAKYNNTTVSENISMRTRLQMRATSNGWGREIAFLSGGTVIARAYLCMTNAGGSYNGWVHFFKMFDLQGLTQLPTSGGYTLTHPTGAQAYQQIRFDNSYGITALTWQYITS